MDKVSDIPGFNSRGDKFVVNPGLLDLLVMVVNRTKGWQGEVTREQAIELRAELLAELGGVPEETVEERVTDALDARLDERP